jgi:hypothetical protein
MVPISVKVKHKKYGEGKIKEINCKNPNDVRIFVHWDNVKRIIGGWYSPDNLEFEKK